MINCHQIVTINTETGWSQWWWMPITGWQPNIFVTVANAAKNIVLEYFGELRHLSIDVFDVWQFNTLRPIQNGRHFAGIFKCIFWMIMYEFRLEFHWRLFLNVQLLIAQHWFRQWFGDHQYLNQLWLDDLRRGQQKEDKWLILGTKFLYTAISCNITVSTNLLLFFFRIFISWWNPAKPRCTERNPWYYDYICTRWMAGDI